MKIFLDFDDTLFNTRAFIVDMKGVFEECGISKALFQSAYQEVKVGSNHGERTYDFDAHIRALQRYCSFDEKNLRNKIQAFVENGNRFLFPDVKSFLSLLKKNNYSPIILSFGTSDFQRIKIIGTGIQSFVEKVIITSDDKVGDIRREMDTVGQNTWFFDDRMKYIDGVKHAFPFAQTVFMRRAEGRYHDEPGESCDYAVKDLVEAGKILREHF